LFIFPASETVPIGVHLNRTLVLDLLDFGVDGVIEIGLVLLREHLEHFGDLDADLLLLLFGQLVLQHDHGVAGNKSLGLFRQNELDDLGEVLSVLLLKPAQITLQ
jgi:hypothetical protein